MAAAIRALFLEDNEDDALIIARTIIKAGYDLSYLIISSSEKLRAELAGGEWDIIISDFAMPHFTGLDALHILDELKLDIPLIMVSGTITEEEAVSSLRAGAKDFIIKGNNSRLIPAIERELNEARIRKEHAIVQDDLKESEDMVRRQYQEIQAQYRALADMNKELSGIHDEVLAVNSRLELEKERLATTLRSLGEGVITTDIGGRIDLMNSIAEKYTGCTQEDARGKPVGDIFNVLDMRTNEKISDSIGAAPGPDPDALIGRSRYAVLVMNDGGKINIETSSVPIRDHNGAMIGMVIVFRDITEKLKMEEELLKTSKIESLGVFAGGIAHDFNNILTAIFGNISIMALTIDERHMDILKNIEHASVRARDLTLQLMTFAKGGIPIKTISSIGDLLRETARFALAGSNIRLDLAIPDDLLAVEFDQGQISQVVNNLIINALDAMPHGGTIRIAVENVTLTHSPDLPLRDGNYIKIVVRDQGTGIPREVLPKIFDPYFTTKKSGHGLGLSSTYSIIKKHDGHITVDSEPQVGTEFSIYLPALDSKYLGPEKENLCRETVATGNGRILIMDDEEMVLQVLCAMVRELGYDAVCVPDGASALVEYKIAQDTGLPFTGVIMDVTVPGGMGAEETIKRLLRLDPHARAIVTTGYSNEPIIANYDKFGFAGYIVKPFAIDLLAFELKKMIMCN